MNKTIWKFTLELTDIQPLFMPEKAEILTVQNQDNRICLWAIVNPELPSEERSFEVHGTGHSIYYDMGMDRKYIGTAQMGALVWHVFERL